MSLCLVFFCDALELTATWFLVWRTRPKELKTRKVLELVTDLIRLDKVRSHLRMKIIRRKYLQLKGLVAVQGMFLWRRLRS